MANGKIWTIEEDKLIRDLAGTHSLAEISKKLNRSKEAIQIRGSRILKISFHHTKWSDSDIQLLLVNYSKLSSTELVDLLKRPYNTIKSKAQKLKLVSKHYINQLYFTKEEFLIEITSFVITSKKHYDNLYKLGKLPQKFPPKPDYTYRIKWNKITGCRSKNMFLPFEEAKQFAISLSITKKAEWDELCSNDKIPSNIPFAPHIKYKNDGWISWYHFLTGFDDTWLPFEEVRDFMRSLRLSSQKEWFKWWDKNKPHNIPRHPDRIYI